MRSTIVYGSEMWAMMTEQSGRLEHVEMRMVRWMCGASLRDRVWIESGSDTVKPKRLRWLGHVLQKNDDDWVKKITSFEVEDKRGQRRPRMTWDQVVERNMRECGLKREDAKDGER